MNYFCRANCVSSKDKEITTYIIFPNDEQLTLDENMLKENQQFKETSYEKSIEQRENSQ